MTDDGSGISEPAGMDDDDTKLRVRVPHFPIYSELRHLLRVWPGRPRKQVTGLRATILDLRGTRKYSVDWTDPATWISERLDGSDRELAQTIWDRSKGEVNPRHIYGHWLLAQRYGLLREDSGGLLQIIEAGRNFLEMPGGETETLVDEAEGLSKLLSIVADTGPGRAGRLLEEWADYLRRRSAIRSESMIKDTMRRRLANLVARGLVERKGNLYAATPGGLLYLTSEVLLDDGKGGTVAWKPEEIGGHQGGRKVCRAEEIELHTGDHIRWTRNDAHLGLALPAIGRDIVAGNAALAALSTGRPYLLATLSSCISSPSACPAKRSTAFSTVSRSAATMSRKLTRGGGSPDRAPILRRRLRDEMLPCYTKIPTSTNRTERLQSK